MPKAQTEPVGLHQRVSPFGGEMIAAMTFPEGCKINRERPYLPPLAAQQQFDASVFNSWPTVGRTRTMLLCPASAW